VVCDCLVMVADMSDNPLAKILSGFTKELWLRDANPLSKAGTRGKRQKRAEDDAVPHIIESDRSPAACRKSWARLIQKI
jgi:hypothetical protein